jgi:hypothetical protein
MNKSQKKVGLAQENGSFGSSIVAEFVVAGKRHSNTEQCCARPDKSNNEYDFTRAQWFF